MNNKNVIVRQLGLYLVGLFFLSFGVSLSIIANLGVSPVSSLSYAVSLTTGLSVGITTIMAHILFILIQVILSKRFDWKNSLIQLMIAFLFGFFIDASLLLIRFILPIPEAFLLQVVYLAASLFLVATGLFGYSAPKFTLMPYDELTKVISSELNMPFSKAKITGDVANVIVAGLICLVFLRSFGSIGIGTIVASLSIGKILGWWMKHFQEPLAAWIDGRDKTSFPTAPEETELTSSLTTEKR